MKYRILQKNDKYKVQINKLFSWCDLGYMDKCSRFTTKMLDSYEEAEKFALDYIEEKSNKWKVVKNE